MAEHREVRNVRLYLKEPNTDRLRKGAAGTLRHLQATGWRELERWHTDRYITIQVERTGSQGGTGKLPPVAPPPPRQRRDGNFPGGRGGPVRR